MYIYVLYLLLSYLNAVSSPQPNHLLVILIIADIIANRIKISRNLEIYFKATLYHKFHSTSN